MKKSKLIILVISILSTALLLTGCGVTNQPPVASFSAGPTESAVSLEVSFDASGSNDPDGDIFSYNWEFGDGSSGSGETATHTYDSPGDYTVELTVTDNDGTQDTLSSSISVPPNKPPLPPG